MPDYTTPEEKERAAAMDVDILDLRRQGVSFVEIGRLMAEKYPRTGRGGPMASRRPLAPGEVQPYGKQYMSERWRAAIAAVPARKVEALRAELNERLEMFLEQVEVILNKDHYAHSNGRVVELHGKPMLDDGPKLAAIAEGRKLLAEIRTLNGATVPVKQELDLGGAVRYEIVGVDMDKLT